MYYRVDKRKFEECDIIKPSTTFEGVLEKEKKEVEDWLNKTRPDGIPERGNCLFLFQDIISALIFYSKFGGNIYRVSIAIPYLCRNDMNKIDNILDVFRFTEDEGLRTAVVNEYWKGGTHTFNPCYEILASSAKVEELIIDDSYHKQLKKEYELGYSMENTSVYKKIFKNNIDIHN